MAVIKIVQSPDDLPDLSSCPLWVADTETSGISIYHGHRACGLALCAVSEDRSAAGTAYYIPIRHADESRSAFIEAEGHKAVSSAELKLAPGSSSPGVYKNLSPEAVFAWLKPYAEDASRRWVAHNFIFDMGVFKVEDIEFAGPTYDTMVLAHLIKSDRHRGGYALDALIRTYELPYSLHFYNLLMEYLGKNQKWPACEELAQPEKDYSQVPADLLGMYACDDVLSARDLFNVLRDHALLAGTPENFGNPAYTQKALRASDQALIKVLFEMQWNGVRIDRAKIVEAKADAERQIDYIWTNMIALSGGKEFNVASPKQTEAALVRAGGEVKFWTKKLQDQKKQKKDKYTDNKAESSGRSCWNSAALMDYLDIYKANPESSAYKFLVAFRTCRQLQRVVTAYLDAYLQLADSKDILHGNFDPTGTRTGRLSSWQPNLQNVTKPEGNADSKAWEKAVAAQEAHEDDSEDDTLDVFVPLGSSQDFRLVDFYQRGILLPERELTAPEILAKRIRSFFIARPGSQVVSIDYSSVEYRVAAYLSQDQALIAEFVKNPDLDFHQFCADIARVSRSEAKTVNFGILYGMGKKSLASLLRVSEYEAERILLKITSAVPAMKQAFLWAKDKGKVGYIQNPMGRVVKVLDDKAYAALNYLVQGFCGDIMRKAMQRVSKLIKMKAWPVLMMLTVHDELVFDIPKWLVAEAAPLIAAEMCRVPEVHPMPITCDIEVGDNWGEMQKFKDWLKAS